MVSQCSLLFISLLSEVDEFFICLRVILISCVLPVILEDFDFFTPQFKSSFCIGNIRPLSVYMMHVFSSSDSHFPFDFAYVILFCHTKFIFM